MTNVSEYVEKYDRDAGIIQGPFEDCDCPSHHQHGARGLEGCPECAPAAEADKLHSLVTELVEALDAFVRQTEEFVNGGWDGLDWPAALRFLQEHRMASLEVLAKARGGRPR